MKQAVIDLLSKELKLKKEEVENLIEIPPNSEFGDYAFPCFSLAKSEGESPLLIAEHITEKLRKKLPKEISGMEAKAGYINFFINKKVLAEKVLKNAVKKDFGKINGGKGTKIAIDMSSPNIAKPFGIGHLRSTIIGNSIAKICEYQGYKTIKINYLGDWGTQFGKIIVGYKRFGDEKKLKENPIWHMLEIYIKANSEEYEQEARGWFKKLEEGDKEAVKLWKMFKELSIKKFNEIYKLLNVKFDVISGESEYNNKINAIIKELKQKDLLEKSEGALIVDLEKYNLGIALIQKSDGTTLYVTRDLAAAIDRHKKYNFNKMIYEVGQEQTLHFRQLFKILELLSYKWSKDCVHVSHGLYLNEDGKRFATRKGKTIFMEEVLNETIELAKKELEKRYKLNKKELKERAKKIALSAIIYGDLKNYRENNVVFDIQKFLNFEGDTGPYLLYSYARASSILKKVKSRKPIKIIDLKKEEIELIKKLEYFPDVVKKSFNNLAPNLIANYSFELAQIFNEFYHKCPVIGNMEEGFRLELVKAFRNVIKSSLSLLGIDAIEEM